MKRTKKTVLYSLGAAAAGAGAFSVLSCFVAGYLLRIATDRDLPQEIKSDAKIRLLTGCGKKEEFQKTAAAQKLKNAQQEAVCIVSYDGLRLVGHWIACKKPKRAIVAMHGWRSCWTRDFCGLADFWQSAGCSVLYAEQRGQGESGGKYMSFGINERFDTLSWVKWVNEKTGNTLPVYLCGISMGATAVLMSAGLSLPENVKGIVADCGFTSPDAIWRHVVKNNLHLPYALYSPVANSLCKKRIHAGAQDFSAVDAMKRCAVPVLFIHGSNDRFVPIEMTYENYLACAACKELVVIPGAGHAMSYFTDPEKYKKAMCDFWEHQDV